MNSHFTGDLAYDYWRAVKRCSEVNIFRCVINSGNTGFDDRTIGESVYSAFYCEPRDCLGGGVATIIEIPFLKLILKTGLRNIAYPSVCLLYTSPSPRDQRGSRMPSSA